MGEKGQPAEAQSGRGPGGPGRGDCSPSGAQSTEGCQPGRAGPDHWVPWHARPLLSKGGKKPLGRALNSGGRARGEQAGSNGNQSEAKCSGRPPMVSMGTELGGGALAWRRQQMWPVQGWLGGGRGGLRLAAGPCLRRGRPGGACGGASSPRPTSPRPHTGRGRLPLCSPPAGPAPGQHRLGWAWASLTAPMSAERGPLPVSTGQTQWSRLVQQRTRPRRDLRGLVTCRSCQSPPSPSHGLPERAPDLSKRCPESPECRTTL